MVIMKRLILLSALLFAFYPLSAYSDQWKLFEHRYEYKPEDVLQATKFVQKKGYWEGFKDDKLAGYVFLSKEWTSKLVGYSGKHLETLIGMDTNGDITGVKIIFHSEPIVLIGLKEEYYLNFIKQYKDRNIKEPVSVGKEISMDAITGATVTAVVQNSIILESARKVAEAAGLLKAAQASGKKLSQKYAELTWEELKKSEAVKSIVVTTKELGLEDEGDYIDLYVANVTPPSIGRNILGDVFYKDIMSTIKEGESAVAIFSKGKGSFKGSGFARGGTFDRFNIEQGSKVYLFTDKDYRVLSGIKAEGAPAINEGGVFFIKDRDFVPVLPFKLTLLLPYRLSAAKKEFRSFRMEYGIPERFLE
ncbi:MAG: FMN-binding protein [Nitrospiraceae bacterium]|nr:MAG: FMN-binding protein [Nitrospiraceae bacterium]